MEEEEGVREGDEGRVGNDGEERRRVSDEEEVRGSSERVEVGDTEGREPKELEKFFCSRIWAAF